MREKHTKLPDGVKAHVDPGGIKPNVPLVTEAERAAIEKGVVVSVHAEPSSTPRVDVVLTTQGGVGPRPLTLGQATAFKTGKPVIITDKPPSV